VSRRDGGPGDGRRGRWRDVDGIVLLDKPSGLTSNQALQRVRRLLGAAKAGHAGTLDPMATGMLPLCFGQATKACGSLLGSRKAYRARIVLGVRTDTGDAEGSVVNEQPVPALDRRSVEAVLAGLTGPLEQVPPMYSALKRGGRPLYELAREGHALELAPRRVEIERLDLLDLGERTIDVDVVCSKGTYIRVLGEDIAARLGTCGHLGALRRLWVAPFNEADMVSLDMIDRETLATEHPAEKPAWLRPADFAFRDRPRIDLDADEALYLRQGRTLAAPARAPPAPSVRAYGPDGRFLGLVTVGGEGSVRVERLFVPGAGADDAGIQA
jgi:tRNA pseudouridine55 synthase